MEPVPEQAFYNAGYLRRRQCRERRRRGQEHYRIRKITPAGVGDDDCRIRDVWIPGWSGAEPRNSWGQTTSPSILRTTSGSLISNAGRIRKISPRGDVTTIAGSGVDAYEDGTGTVASFQTPSHIATDPAVCVCRESANRIRKITTDGVVTTFAA